MSAPIVDQRGRAAAAALHAEVASWIDVAGALDSIDLVPLEPRRRVGRPMVAALSGLFVAVIAILGVIALASDTNTPATPRSRRSIRSCLRNFPGAFIQWR